MQEDLIELGTPDIPVYLFTGFIEAGKTKFIQETLGDKRFNRGERTLLLICEEGEEEYDLRKFKKNNIILYVVENEEDLTVDYLHRLEKKYDVERVLVEYNGMWLLDSFYSNMPPNWIVYQEFMFADCRSFISYNANMRQLVYDKMKSCELLVLNRAPKGVDMEPYHKIIRGANRNCDIAFEHPDGSVDYDTIEDPLPFDIEADVIEISDRDYAIWYRDLGEELEKYDGKIVSFKGQVSVSDELPEDCFVIGRQLMNCCADDITFAGLIVEKAARSGWATREWVMLKARIEVREHEAYDRVGPVLIAIEVSPAEPAEEEVATFY